jgi:hypothetical protein
MKTPDEIRRYKREWKAKRYAEDPEYRAKIAAKAKAHGRRYTLKSTYGLSLEDYDAMVERQGGVCLICDRPTEVPLYVDHCHATNLVRALLCRSCNAGLGHFGENPFVMRRSVLFVELWLQHIFELLNQEDNGMTCNETTVDANGAAPKASAKPMRDAILHELNQPLGADAPAPRNRLQTVARALLSKAEAQDMQAIKEVLDRVDGPVPMANPFNVSWPTALPKLTPRKQTAPREKQAKADAAMENEAPPSDADGGSPPIRSGKRTAEQ